MRKLREALEIIGCAALILAFCYFATVLAFSLEPNAAPQASLAPSSSSGSATEPAAPALSHPLNYSATVTQEGRTRYYVRSER